MQNIIKNWILYLTRPNKLQFLNAGNQTESFDTSFCITFSALKIIQAILNFQIENRLISVGLIAWLNANGYMNASGQVDLSPRFTGTMAHTTIYGNTQWNVMNCIYAYGVIPEAMHPNQANSWNEYSDQTKITQAMKDLGMEFLKRIRIEIDDATLADLINSPLWATVKFADGDGILSPIGADNHGVAVVDDGDGNTFAEESDSYWQEIKKYARTAVHNLNKFTINEKSMDISNLEGQIIAEGEGHGRKAIVIHGQAREITPDRVAQACLYKLTNKTISTADFDSMPKGLNF
jgi:hypothetical protein